MKILLPALASSTQPDGVSRHAANLALSLLLQPGAQRIDLVIGHWQRDAFASLLGSTDSRIRILTANSGKASLLRNHWYWSRLPGLARTLSSDIIHFAYPAPFRRSAIHCPVVVTLHDLYPYDIPENFGYPRVFINRFILRQCLRAVDRIATVSASTAQRLQIHLPSASPKTVVIPNALPSVPLVPPSTAAVDLRGEPFLLCVAQHRRNKNIPIAIRTFHRLLHAGDIPVNSRLLIVGTEGPETISIKRLIHALHLDKQIFLIHGLIGTDLHWCYAHCELMIAPSTIEGFGLPIIEAMQHRARIVCSDIPAFREVAGSYCDYVELSANSVETFVDAARQALAQRRFHTAQLERFSIATIGEAYTSLYRILLQPQQSLSLKIASSPGPIFERGKT